MKPTPDILKILELKIKKTLWVFGSHAFSLILFLILIGLILGGIIFYNYVFLAEEQSPKVAEGVIKFDYKTHQNVLGELQTREQSSQGSPISNQ